MTALAAIAAPEGFSRHGHVYVPTARERADTAWFGAEAEKRRARAGMFGGAHASLLAQGAASTDKWFANGNSDVLSWFGANAEEIYLPGEPASGTITGKIAGNVLSPVTTPAYQQVLTGGAGDPLGAGFDEYTYDGFDAASGSVHDYTTEAVACLTVINTPTWQTAFRSIVGTKSYSGTGWGFWHRSGAARWCVYGTGSSSYIGTANLATSSALYMFGWRSVTSGNIGVVCLGDIDRTSVCAPGDITSSTTFAIGSVGTLRAAGQVTGPTVIWSGANAETVITNRAANLAAWWAA